MKYLYVFMGMLGLWSALTSCRTTSSEEPLISVTIEPQRYFVEQIAGETFQVNCLTPSGQSPETYDPTPQQLMDVGRSVAYFRIGYIGFEQAWMPRLEEQNPQMQVFDLSAGMELIEDHLFRRGAGDSGQCPRCLDGVGSRASSALSTAV